MWYRPTTDFFVYVSPELTTIGQIAAFDLDWTLVRPAQGKFPRSPDDIYVLPNRLEVLTSLANTGHTLVIFTNQKALRAKHGAKARLEEDQRRLFSLQRVTHFVRYLSQVGLPVIVMMATGDDIYRKPEIGMWNALQSMLTVKTIFFSGDAAGRGEDFSDSDKEFARRAGLQFYLPEDVFPS